MITKPAGYIVAIVVIGLAATACGDDAGGTTTSEAALAPATTAVTVATTTTAAPTTTTATPPTTVATTTTEPSVVFASLSEYQQEFVGAICLAATDPGSRNLVGEIHLLSVLNGESGVGALEEAWIEIGQGGDWDELLAVALPICTEIGWAPELSATATTAVLVASAVFSIEIGDLLIVGETEGCPLTEILAGEYWVGPNRDFYPAGDGEEWQVSLSVNATEDDLKWGFSAIGSPTYWVSSDQFQKLDATVEPETGVFETIFNDQIASVSGGKPDTPGTVTITCG